MCHKRLFMRQKQREGAILTQRETEIASFVCQGNTNKEIAKLLFIEGCYLLKKVT